MTKIVCDRCGQFIPLNEEERPWRLNVFYSHSYPSDSKILDLCLSCKEKLLKWLDIKEGEVS